MGASANNRRDKIGKFALMERTVESFTITVAGNNYFVRETDSLGHMRFYIEINGQELIFEANENADLRPINSNTVDADLINAIGNAIESYCA